MSSDIEPEDPIETIPDGNKRSRGVYLLPNLFTTGALFCGFYAIVAGMTGRFEAAAIAIFVAMLFDGLDGRVARMTNTQSKFGAEYDSLSDMVSFGVAPALVSFTWVLEDAGRFGWLAAFIYCACAALRLARFNTQIGSVDKGYFMGLPSPAAAATVAGLIWYGSSSGFDPTGYQYVVAFYVALIGLLMVSNILFYSFKDVDFRGKISFVKMIAIVLLAGFISTEPELWLWLFLMAYTLSGPILWLKRRSKSKVS